MSETANPQQARCLRPGCGRRLTAVASIARGYGRHCAAKIRKAAAEAVAADFKPEQFAKALELISDGGLVAHPHAGVYRAVSSRGDVTYLTSPHGCNCPAGLRSRSACYHQAAARVLEATKTALAKAA
jgi:Family of unknown function (DUF6011)